MEPLAASQAKTGTYPSCSDQAPKLFVLIVGPEAQAGGLSPSLGDCPGVPNSRWLWGSVALPACGQACARSRRGGAGSGRGCRRRSWRRKRPHPQAGGRLGIGPQLAERIGFSLFTLRWWEKVLVLCFSHITFRLIPLSRSDPFLGFVRLRQRFVCGSQRRAFGAASLLADQQNKCSGSYQHRNQNTDDETHFHRSSLSLCQDNCRHGSDGQMFGA